MTYWVSKFILLVACLCSALGELEIAAHLEPSDSQNINLDKFNWHSIPSLGVPVAKPGQVFVLRAPGISDLTIVPVQYVSDKGDEPGFRCGVYFIPQGGTETFVKVVPSDVYPSWCPAVDAVGATSDLGPRPRLIFTFHSQTENSPEGIVPFVLSWSQKKGTYQLDETQTKWLLDRAVLSGHGGLIAQVRGALAHYPHTSKEQHGKPIQ